ncbi:hypothetical protein [Dactylosporangium sp. NPDC050588]|uniref:hypothetical protein n=1 Tax=Dactylosporangium sp. NPDC050588 TaxID=3157211 RepID=UPI0033CAECCC
MSRTDTLDHRTAVNDDVDIPGPGDPVGAGGGNGLTRVTVNLNQQAMKALEQISSTERYSKTDTINRALQIYAIVQEIMDRNEGVLRVQHANGEIERIHII